MRIVAGCLLAAIALVACSTGSAGPAQATSLTITYWPDSGNASEKTRWTLRCAPAGGTLPRPVRACKRLAAGGMALFAPVSPRVACTEIYGGPQTARVVGTLHGKRIFASFSRVNGCQISRWQNLSPSVLPPGGVT